MNDCEIAVPEPSAFEKPYFFLTFNPALELLYVSPSVEQILGFNSDQLIGRKFTDLVAPSAAAEETNNFLSNDWLPGDKNRDGLLLAATRDGEIRAIGIQAHGKKNHQGQLVAICCVAQDITEGYLAEQELLQRRTELAEIEASLSSRERHVLELVVGGRLNKSIANQLSITSRAVERIRSRLMEKFHAETSAELVSLATELKVLGSVMLMIHQRHGTLPVPNFRMMQTQKTPGLN